MDQLDAAKSRVKGRVLGQNGVHGIGLRRAREQVVLYASAGGAGEEVLAVAREAAAPYQVIVVEEERPVMTTAATVGRADT